MIRLGLDVGPDASGSRNSRALFLGQLYPITELKGAAFLRVFLDIVLCLYLAWTKGDVHHRYPSFANFMYRKRALDGDPIGVLIDWDLATTSETPHDGRGVERTGSMPFMAQELLYAAATGKQVEHLYRHDLEACYWIYLWFCHCIGEDGSELGQSELGRFKDWKTGEYTSCHDAKAGYEVRSLEYARRYVVPTKMALWEIAKAWRESMMRARPDMSIHHTAFEASPQEATERFLGVLESVRTQKGLEVHGLEGVDMLHEVDKFVKTARLRMEDDDSDSSQ